MPHGPAIQPRFQHVTPAFRTFCGEDALAALPRELDRLGASRAVIVCAPWVRDHPHVLADIEKALARGSPGASTAWRTTARYPWSRKPGDRLSTPARTR